MQIFMLRKNNQNHTPEVVVWIGFDQYCLCNNILIYKVAVSWFECSRSLLKFQHCNWKLNSTFDFCVLLKLFINFFPSIISHTKVADSRLLKYPQECLMKVWTTSLTMQGIKVVCTSIWITSSSEAKRKTKDLILMLALET